MQKSILETVHDAAKGLPDIGLIHLQTMRKFDTLCLPPHSDKPKNPMNLSTTIYITPEEVKKVAHLARLRIEDAADEKHAKSLSDILGMVALIQEQDTSNVAPMFSALDTTLEPRQDVVTEENQRELFQKIAPRTESGLYIVPQVIE